MIAVYYQSRNREQGEAVIARLEDEGHSVRACNARHFDADQLEPVERIYHDGTEPAVARAYEAAGVACEAFAARSVPEPREEPEAPPAGGYYVEETRGWYKLIGPDGEQVGKSQRSEDDAWALMEDADGND